MEWHIDIDGTSISMDEDMPNWPTDDIPYKGVLTGDDFDGRVDIGGNYLQSACKWRGAALSGHFNNDRSAFEATEYVYWGTADAGTTVTRRWSGHLVR